MIVGPDSNSVQRAREMMELEEATLELKPHQADWLSQRLNSGLLSESFKDFLLFRSLFHT